MLLDGDTEEERWRQLFATVGFTPESGLLILVPITSYGPLGPFFTRPDKLTDFFEQHIASAVDCVLSSRDLFVLAPQEGRAIIYDHSELALLLPFEKWVLAQRSSVFLIGQRRGRVAIALVIWRPNYAITPPMITTLITACPPDIGPSSGTR